MTEYPRLITYSNFGYINYAINLLENLIKNVKNHKLTFYCLDNETYELLTSKYSHNENFTFEKFFQDSVSKEFQNYGTQGYNKILHMKIKVLYESLNEYNFVHFIDCDVVCLKEPSLDYYEKYSDKDIVFQFDVGLGHGHGFFNNWVCMGNALLKNTPGSIYILNKIQEYQVKYPGKNDQECLKKYFDDNNIKDIREEKNANLYVFPYEEYTNGWILKNKYLSLDSTYFFHANHVIGNNEKIQLLKEANSWYL
jgi:hypothetical protein